MKRDCDICDKPEDSTDPIVVLCEDCYKKAMTEHKAMLDKELKERNPHWH